MKTHAVREYDLLKHSERVIAKTHHEYWASKGYPEGLSHTDIPLEGGIMVIIGVINAPACPTMR